MALQRSRTQIITIHQIVDAVDKDVAKFATTSATLRVSIQPLESQLAAQIYGAQISTMKLLLTNKPTALLPEGAGVCVDVLGTALPDYRVVSSKTWGTHTAVHLRWFAEGDRGEYGT
jgi:hypothetical protein